MELIRNVQRWGNSSGVLLPREWLNREVKIVLVERSLNIQKEIFDILNAYLGDIMGLYITGSYARGEQDKDSDIDIVAISNNTQKEIISGKYNISIIPLHVIKKTLENNPLMILPRLIEAKSVTNSQLLDTLRTIEINKDSFKNFIEDSESIIKINEGLIELEKDSSKSGYLESNEIIYSIVLRLRGVYLIKCILDKEPYSNADFLRFIKKSAGKDYLNVYEIYRRVKEGSKIKQQISITTANELLNLLKESIKHAKKPSRHRK